MNQSFQYIIMDGSLRDLKCTSQLFHFNWGIKYLEKFQPSATNGNPKTLQRAGTTRDTL